MRMLGGIGGQRGRTDRNIIYKIIAERSEANNRAVCDLGWRMYIYIYICKCGPGPRGSPRQQCTVVRGSIRLIERPACARAQSAIDPTWCTFDSSKVSAVCEDS